MVSRYSTASLGRFPGFVLDWFPSRTVVEIVRRCGCPRFLVTLAASWFGGNLDIVHTTPKTLFLIAGGTGVQRQSQMIMWYHN